MMNAFALRIALALSALASSGTAITAHDLQQRARVIVVTLDGARPQDALDTSGAFAAARDRPVLRRLLERVKTNGALWHGTTSSRVPLSLPGYQALFAGAQTGCDANDCARITRETFLESVARRLALTRAQVVAAASWSRLARAVSAKDGAIVVDVGAEGPPRAGGPPWPNARWDADTIDRALQHWRADPRVRLMYVGLLDMDERAHRGDQQGTVRAMLDADVALGKILDAVDALPPEERALTTLIVTADHGRGLGALWTEHGKYVHASDRIFMAAVGDLVQVRGMQPKPFEQKQVRATVERLLGLCPDDDGAVAAPIDAIVGRLPCVKARE